MSDEMIERILATYDPVEDKPGYVWIKKYETYVKIDILREVYEEEFAEKAREKESNE